MVSGALLGGISNQMFVIAAAHALALRNNDISGFNLETCFTPLQGNKATKYRNSIFKNINEIGDYNFKHIYNEPKHSYTEIPYQSDLLLKGYYQSSLYFEDFKQEIIDLFYLDPIKINTIEQFIQTLPNQDLPFTSIHVRRGDYLKFPDIHPVCTIEYYKKAMETIGENNFIFVSDDMNWVKENFKGDNIFYSPFTDEVDDLILMTQMDNNIIANSSFSWWGAWLNQYSEKIIISPSIWFGINGPQENSLIPEEWLKI